MYEANALLKIANEELLHITQHNKLFKKASNAKSRMNKNATMDPSYNKISKNSTVLTNSQIVTAGQSKNLTGEIGQAKGTKKTLKLKRRIKDFITTNMINVSRVNKLNKRRFGQKEVYYLPETPKKSQKRRPKSSYQPNSRKSKRLENPLFSISEHQDKVSEYLPGQRGIRTAETKIRTNKKLSDKPYILRKFNTKYIREAKLGWEIYQIICLVLT